MLSKSFALQKEEVGVMNINEEEKLLY